MTLPIAGPDEAMSNRIPEYMAAASAWVKSSPVDKLAPVAERIVAIAVGSLFAGMDSFYHFTGAVIKTTIFCVQGTIWVLSAGHHGQVSAASRKEIGTHIYKSSLFFCSIFSSPVLAAQKPERLIEFYRSRGMIKPPKNWKDKLEDKANEVKDKAHAFVLEHQKKIIFGLVALGTASTAFTLHRYGPTQRQLSFMFGNGENSPGAPQRRPITLK